MTAALILLLALLSISGCANDNAAGSPDTGAMAPRDGGTLYVDNAQEPPTLNPWLATGGMAVVRIITDPLRATWIQLDDHGRWQPVIAERVPDATTGDIRNLPDGGVSIRLPIRNEARWSDGHPIRCDDLVFTWQTVMDDRWQVGTRLGWSEVRTITCPSPTLARIILARPYAPFLQDLLASAPLPAHALRSEDFNSTWSNAVTPSSGPFVFRSWRRGTDLVLERNDQWWGRRPHLDRIVWRFVPDAQTMKLDLRMQEAQLIGLAPDSNLPAELRSIATARHSIRPGAAWEQLALNTQSPQLADVRVRRAIAYSIDRRSITDVVLRGQATILDSTLLPSQGDGYTPAFARYRPNPEEAVSLMEDAGWHRNARGVWSRRGRTARLSLVTTAGNPLRVKTVQLLQQQLEAAGFDARITIAKPEIFFASLVAPGRFDLAIFSFGSGADPDQSRLFSCSEIPQAPDWRGKNDFRYCNRQLDGLLAAARRELDPASRAEIMRHQQEILAADLPTLPLFQPPETLAWDVSLHGVRPNPIGRLFWNIEDWWLAP